MNPYDKTFCDQIVADARSYGYDFAAFVNGRFIYNGDVMKAVGNAHSQCSDDPDPRIRMAFVQLGRDIDYKLNSSVMNATLRDLQYFIQHIQDEEIDPFGAYSLADIQGLEEYSLHIYAHRNQFNICRKDQFGGDLCIAAFVFLDKLSGEPGIIQCYSAIKGNALYDHPKNYSSSTKIGDIDWVSTFPYEGNLIGDIIKRVMLQHPPKKENIVRSKSDLPMVSPLPFTRILEWLLDNIGYQNHYLFNSRYAHFYPKLIICRGNVRNIDPICKPDEVMSAEPDRTGEFPAIYQIFHEVSDNEPCKMIGFVWFYANDTVTLNAIKNPSSSETNCVEVETKTFNVNDPINKIGDENSKDMQYLIEIIYKMIIYPGLSIWEM